VGTSTSVVSKDGKTVTLTGKGTDAKRQTLSSTQVYDKSNQQCIRTQGHRDGKTP